MKYETKLQIQSALSKRGWMHAAQVINEFIEILEATDEQKALRAMETELIQARLEAIRLREDVKNWIHETNQGERDA